MNIQRPIKLQDWKPSLTSMTKHQNNLAFKEIELPKLGPFTIMKQINVVTFQHKLLDSMKIHFVFHVFLLESYHASTIPIRIHKPPPHVIVNGKHKYKVEIVFDSKVLNRQFLCFIHWCGHDMNKHS